MVNLDPNLRSDGTRPRVVIVGAGFGGLQAAKQLRNKPVDLSIIDRRNHHVFQPLLYQVALAELAPSNIAVPIRSLFRKCANVRVVLAAVTAVETEHRQLHLDSGECVPYDYLILAAGAKTSYFGHDEWARVAPGLKSLEDAIEIRKRILSMFEYAEKCRDAGERQEYLTFVVIGGGPTGVEMAGAIAEMARVTMARDFRNFDPSIARVILAEGADRILGTFHPDLSAYATRALEKRGVEVRTHALASAIDETGLMLGDEHIRARTIIWAAGVTASTLAKTLGEVDRMGRIPVLSDLTIAGHSEIQVIGDMARVETADGKILPAVSPVAIQQGKHAARNILRAISGQKPLPFSYFDKGMMATIGRNSAVADLRFVRFRGYCAWLAWLFLHIMYLVGFRNRIITLFEWAYAYFSFNKGSRLITWNLHPGATEQRNPSVDHPDGNPPPIEPTS